MREVGEALRALGAGAVLVKGATPQAPRRSICWWTGRGPLTSAPVSRSRSTGRVVACLPRSRGTRLGLPLREAVALGKNVVSGAIAASIPAPDGRRMANLARSIHPCGCFSPPGSP